MDDTDNDVYVDQLKEVFDSCDVNRNGTLNRKELTELCKKLQLEDQVDNLLGELLGDAQDGQVDFETFKEGFVIVLSADMDSIGNITDTEDDHSVADILDNQDVQHVSPKYVKGEKRYGRRSRPDFELDYSADFSEIDSEVSHRSKRHGSKRESKRDSKRDSKQDLLDDNVFSEKSTKRDKYKDARTLSFADSISEMEEENGNFLNNDLDDRKEDLPEINVESGSKKSVSPKNETFEAEGQLNASMGQFEIASPTDEDQVRAIWEEVGVGEDGFLNLKELALVCEHIGMEDMDQEELQNLYSKLDQDDDGKVGFQEFLEGLFRHDSIRAPTTPLPTALSATQKVKLRMAITGSSMEESMHRTATPSVGTFQGSNLLSILDVDNSGYVTQDSLTEHWEQQGIENTSEVLKTLDVDTEAGKINISDLSMALEHVLLTTGDSNGVYQAALTSYQTELKHLKSQLDASIDENNKLKMDVAELNQRGNILAVEVDDRHAHLEKSNEIKLRESERRNQEKMTLLQSAIEKERELMTSQAAKQKQKLEDEIDRQKAEDVALREKVTILQKENLRMEKDIGDFSERLVVLKKVNQKLQKEVDGFQELEARLAEWESSRANMSKEQQDYYEQQIREFQQQGREMQDRLDEVHQELAITKQQSIEKKVRRKGSRVRDINKPNRLGSVLSDYTKPVVVKRRQSSSDNESDMEDTSSGTTRRQLPVALRSTGDGGSTEGEDPKMDIERAKFEAEIDELKEKHSREILQIRKNSDRERRDIETQFKLEITELEDNFEKEREEIMNDFDKEKEIIQGDLAKEMEDKLRKVRTDLKEKFQKEKVDLEQKHVKEMKNQVKEVQDGMKKEKAELENLLKSEKSEIGETLIQQRNLSDEKLRKLREELERKYSDDIESLKEQFLKEKSEILKDYERRIAQLELELKKSEEANKMEKEQLINNMQREQEEYKELSEFDKAELSNSFLEEKEELVEKHRREMEKMEMELLERVRNQTTDLEEKYAMDLQMQREDMQETERRLHNELKEDIERDYAEKMMQVRQAYDIEKTSLEMQNEVISDKLRQAEIAKEGAIVAVNLKTQQSAQSFDQAKAKSLEEELEKLKNELKQSSKKLTESQITVSVLESQHTRELHRLRGKQDLAIQDELGQLRTKLIEKEVKLKEVEKRLLEHQAERDRIEEKVKQECEKDTSKLKQSKHDLEKKYKKNRRLLDEYVKQLKETLNKSAKSDTLVKDLYLENSKMQQALFTTEERQKTSEKNSYELMEKNKAYYRILKKVCPAAL